MDGKTFMGIESTIEDAGVWLQIEGVEGVAQGERAGRQCILVLTSCPPERLRGRVPDCFQGFPVVIQRTGGLPTACG